MNAKLIALLAGAGALAAGYAVAGEKKDGDYDWKAKLAEHFAEVDADGSGNISKDEYLAYKAAEAEKSWGDHDLGDDGELSLEEATAHHEAKMAEKKAKMKEHHEKKKDDRDDG